MILNYYLNDNALIDYNFPFLEIDNSRLYYNVIEYIRNLNDISSNVMGNLRNQLVDNEIIQKRSQI